MKWSADAQKAIAKVPFFVRTKVKKKVQARAAQKGKNVVELVDLNELKRKFLSKGGMESQIRGYDISSCFGGSGCPNTACPTENLAQEIEPLLKKEDLLSFLKTSVKGELKFHHEFKVALSDCPNACSRPQIADIGIIGAAEPMITEAPCTGCKSCMTACREDAILFESDISENFSPVIRMEKCLFCAGCVRACPTGTLVQGKKGFRVLLGGRLGRHPRLALEVPGIQSRHRVIEIVKSCLKFYKTHSKNGKRFSHILKSVNQVL